jgi:hypothetical protein
LVRRSAFEHADFYEETKLKVVEKLGLVDECEDFFKVLRLGVHS